MVSSTALFDLIKSLTPSEKRHFKIFSAKSSVKESSKYEKLFDIIYKQDVYSEAEIKKKMADEKVAGYFPVAKNYLYELVKDSLHVYHLNLSRESIFKKELHSVSILYQKGLYDQCEKLIRKVEKEMADEENYLGLYEIRIWKLKLARTITKKVSYKTFIDFADEVKHAIENENNKADYSRLMSVVSYLLRLPNAEKNEGVKKRLEAALADPLLSSIDKAMNNGSKILFNYIYLLYYSLIIKDYRKSFEFGKKNVSIFESNPKIIKEDPLSYIRAVNNLAWSGFRLKAYEECEALVIRMNAVLKKNKIKLDVNGSVGAFLLYNITVTNVAIKKVNFEKIHLIIDELEKGFSLYKGKMYISDEILLTYNVAYLYFGMGQYKKSQVWLHQLLNMGNDDLQWDISEATRILMLLIHIENDEMDLLSYTSRSVNRFFKRTGNLNKVELLFFKFVKQLLSTKKDKRDIYKDTLQAFEKISKKDKEKSQAFNNIDFASWLESKIYEKSFAAVVKEKLAFVSGR